MARLEYRRAFGGGYNQILNYADLAGSGSPHYTLPGQSQTRDSYTAALGLRAENESLLSIDLEVQLDGGYTTAGGQMEAF